MTQNTLPTQQSKSPDLNPSMHFALEEEIEGETPRKTTKAAVKAWKSIKMQLFGDVTGSQA